MNELWKHVCCEITTYGVLKKPWGHGHITLKPTSWLPSGYYRCILGIVDTPEMRNIRYLLETGSIHGEILFKLIVEVPVVDNTADTPNPPGSLPL